MLINIVKRFVRSVTHRPIFALLLLILFAPVTMKAQPYIGEIRLFPYNFAPQGWAFCQGQLLPISQNQALFSLLGTTYGGDGQVTFALPDLRGRVPIGAGQAPGLSNYVLGQKIGEENHSLTVAEMSAHSHLLNVSTSVGSSDSPQGGFPARNAAAIPQYSPSSDSAGAATVVGTAGGSQSHENRQPSLVLNWCIALQGIYPSPTSSENGQ